MQIARFKMQFVAIFMFSKKNEKKNTRRILNKVFKNFDYPFLHFITKYKIKT